MEKLNEEARKFWEEKERQYGAPVRFYTFATFLGKFKSKPLRLGGLVYVIDKKLYFEDFEKDNWFSRLVSRDKKYEKTEFTIDLNMIEKIQLVTKSSSINCILGNINDTETKLIRGIGRFLLQPVVQLKLKNNNSYFFETMNQNEFLNILKFINTS